MGRAIHKLSPRRLEGLKKPGWYGDGGGLWLRIEADLTKRWIFVWVRNKKRREIGLGPFRDFTLNDAREMAYAARKIIKEGGDPLKMRMEVAEEARREAAVEQASESPALTPTFLACAKDYIAAHEDGWSNAKHRWQWLNSLTKHVKPILEKPVDTITEDDLVEVLKPIWNVIPDTAGRVRGRIETILDAAKASKHIASPWENPARWKGNLIHRLPKRRRMSKGHYAAISYEDMPAFFAALKERPAPAARALELTILCATRTSETLGMQWKEVDLKSGIWTVPAVRMKMRIMHRIPLSDAASDILKAMTSGKTIDPDDFVFPGQKPEKPLSQMAMTMVMRRMDLGHFTVHGMRSSFRDYMGDMTEHAETVIEHALAHQVGDSTVRAYRRKDAFDKRKTVMADWANYLLSDQVKSDVQDEDVRAAA
ncbi:tyrosine-type recombinase/integrase [Sphingobium sp. TB-6]|uniref:tyrosine-type recombinase/integrase n=1 Tax=Sphingobium sp. TB-6 TaxID=2728850 RepID=UPI00146A1C2D|nr:site-specific integrase [Sphingobium sp. TB-6]NML91211.1 tyrosine-type recombinase/integrase [Sphingobium sp. TB-6]